jgi:hypothetical protein
VTLDRIAWFVGEIARPLAIIVSSVSASTASVVMAFRVADGSDGSLLAGAIWLGVSVIMGAKAAEEFGKNRNAAKVQVAKAAEREPGRD